MHYKTNTKKILLTLIFVTLTVAGFGLGKVEKASADVYCTSLYCPPSLSPDQTKGKSCSYVDSGKQKDEAACQKVCDSSAGQNQNCYPFYDQNQQKDFLKSKETTSAGKTATTESNDTSGDSICKGIEISSPITWINCILLYILRFLGLFLSAAATLFVKIIDTSVFTIVVSGNSVLYEMWGFVRDILNIAFILVLLFSAFCTVFQIQKYSYKNLLVTLIIMALLVNFSFPIARVIIDFGNVLMYYFINGMGLDSSSFFATFSENSSIQNIVYNNSVDTSTAYLIMSVVFIFIYAVTLAIIAILLLIRIIALAILIIFSSIAFVGSIVPFLSKYASDWWEAIFKYSFFGPIMIFLLVVTSRMMEKTKDLQGAFQTAAAKQSSEASIVGTMAFFAIPVVILWVGISAAQRMSVAGAGAVVGRGTRFMGWAGRTLTGYRAAKWGGKTLAKKAERGLARGKYTWWASPTAFKEAWKERTAEAERKAFKPATGAWRDKLNSVFSRGRDKTRFKDAALQNNILTKQKELEAVNTESGYLSDEFNKAAKVKDTEKMSAILRILANNNDINDFMGANGETMDPSNVREYLYKRLTGAGMNSSQAAKQLNDLGEIAFGKGNFQLFGMGHFNPTTGEYEKNSDYKTSSSGAEIGQIASVIGKTSNVKAQTKADLWHWNSFLQQNANGTTGDLHAAGIAQLEALTPSELNQMGRVRRDFVDKIYQKLDGPSGIRDHSKRLEMMATSLRASGDPRDAEKATRYENQSKIIEKFAENIERLKNDPTFKV